MGGGGEGDGVVTVVGGGPWDAGRVEMATPCGGPLTGRSSCRISIFINENVACLCRLFSSLSHVD